jgi:hypothetical protein
VGALQRPAGGFFARGRVTEGVEKASRGVMSPELMEYVGRAMAAR